MKILANAISENMILWTTTVLAIIILFLIRQIYETLKFSKRGSQMKSLTDVMSQKTDSVRYCCLSHNYSFPLDKQSYETSKYYWGVYTYYQGLAVRGHWIRMYCEMKTVYAPFQILGLEHSKFLALVDND